MSRVEYVWWSSALLTAATVPRREILRAFVVDAYKRPVHEAAVPEPTVGERDVLVQVVAAGVNHLDEKIRTGEFKAILPYKAPIRLGHDVAGTVLRVGAQVQAFAPGDQVFARPRDHRIGTFAERIAIDEADLALAPTTVSPEESASLPLVALTARQAHDHLREERRRRPGSAP